MGRVLFTQKQDDFLFALSFHPSEPFFVKGFSDGTVTACSYDYKGEINNIWTTKRHKGSCRALTYDHEGKFVFSVGLDRVLKKANATDGIVKIKNSSTIDSDPACISVNDTYVAIGTDEGGVYIFNQSDLSLVKHFADVHNDNVAGLFPLPVKNEYTFISCGSTTVSNIDLRKDKPVSESEDQEDDILCGCLSNETTPVFGMSTGVVTVWNQVLEDQQHRIRLSKDSVDCLLPGELDDIVVAGCGDGVAYKVNTRSSLVLKKYNHGGDGVSILEMDYQYHLVTADMDSIKVWMTDEEEKKADKEEGKTTVTNTKRPIENNDSDWESMEEEEEEEEEKKKAEKQTRKKRKRGKASAKSKVHNSRPAISSFDGL
ncbi:uncharacterized protein SAPINGB_P003552 [Magnusiomyces paraingens]|uniref:WD repeat-containing protein JIP5 n=1 Tax=Magnusiomyces paraingens TaxID=2606893 RepID=A0A5E8BXD5_9ASCO|nr:uncharacterized protein SAPINGB_P003552 [Saprochaete ingens]VVT53395.1 unnamed protein product [Saprochaete ingens]